MKALGLGGGGGFGSFLSGLFANGGTFGTAQRFANGGTFTNQIVSSPTLFKFANGGKIGVMGEEGPEAVMPLARGPNGKLGVHAQGGGNGGGGGRPSINVSVTNHNSFAGAIGADSIIAMNQQVAQKTEEQIWRGLQGRLQQLDTDGTIV